MTCAEVERVLPELLEGAPDSGFQSAFESHLRSCPGCSDLVSDLRMISSEARELAESDEPAPRVWVRIEAQLRAEGLIREPVAGRPVLVPDARPGRSQAWWLAPIAAAILAAGAYVVSHSSVSHGPTPQIAIQKAPANAVTNPSAEVFPSPTPSQATPVQDQQQAPAEVANAAAATGHIVEPAPSAEDQQFLSVVSTRVPGMRATYQGQLEAVNGEIHEVQAYLKQNPDDADARQHLMEAYQQKALLYQIALDRIQ